MSVLLSPRAPGWKSGTGKGARQVPDGNKFYYHSGAVVCMTWSYQLPHLRLLPVLEQWRPGWQKPNNPMQSNCGVCFFLLHKSYRWMDGWMVLNRRVIIIWSWDRLTGKAFNLQTLKIGFRIWRSKTKSHNHRHDSRFMIHNLCSGSVWNYCKNKDTECGDRLNWQGRNQCRQQKKTYAYSEHREENGRVQ